MMNGLGFMNAVYATSINTANVYATGDCGQLLKYKGGIVKVDYVQYTSNGVSYPAYCMDKTKQRSQYPTRVYGICTRNDKRCWAMANDYKWVSL